MPRPKKIFDPLVARQVEDMRQKGLPISEVALLCEMSEKVLRRLYRKQLERGKAVANYQIAGKLFELAMAGNVTCLIFWAKTQMGWSTEKPQEQESEPEPQKTGVLVVPGILSESEWLEAAHVDNPQQ